ncbi:MAG: hypothetical protein RL721_1239 [Candidatus Eisenbacteria bacterium]|jgi:DNA-directed RNA polymerase specialized sigma24 family protein
MSARLPKQVRELPVRVRLAAAIEALPETDRLVLSLRLLEGLSVAETAAALKLDRREVERRTDASLGLLGRELGVETTLRRAA